MTLRRLALSACAWLACIWLASATAACAAPSSQPTAAPADVQATSTTASEPQDAVATPEPATTAPARDLDKLRKLKVRTGGPLPPRLLPEPVQLDRSCRSDADCTVKDIGNCCGKYPACVNRDSPADPAAVKAQCAKTGSMSACGYREISGCSCVEGSCIAQMQAIDPSVDPAPLPPEQR